MNYDYDPKAFRKFHIVHRHHAALLSVQRRNQEWMRVGDQQGPYGPEDRATGARYTVLGYETPENRKKGTISYPGDLHAGMFYPEAIFIYGHGESEDEPLEFEQVEEFAQQLHGSETRRVLLPYGNDENGRYIFHRGVSYTPAGTGPNWYNDIEGLLRRKFREGEIEVYPKTPRSYGVTLGLHETYPSTNPDLDSKGIRSEFIHSDENDVLDSDYDSIEAVYEHGKWWINVGATGAQWSVVDCESGGKHHFGFERISQGEE